MACPWRRAVEVLWQAAGHIGPQRLQPFVPELLDRLSRDEELVLTPEIDKLVRHACVATLGRLLAPARASRPPRGATTTRVGTWLRHEIPIRTFTEWDDAGPGFLDIDLVAHCGSSTQGFYLCTLCAVDIATAWVLMSSYGLYPAPCRAVIEPRARDVYRSHAVRSRGS